MTDIASALRDLLGSDEPLDAALDRHFAPGYRQRTDGVWDDRAGFAEHIGHLRTIVAAVDVEVLDEFVDGRRYADRHIVTVTKRDGSRVIQEVYLFGQQDESGRFERIEEVTMMLAGDEGDRGMGSAK
ncbi:nuclear transport factor 2 family protein [Rudaeicoccus suwonensis]|uniref:SnoaL-like protein n=1 Tax=Rudaeicoccus suwonensis TaxID=657409 RepID=A0A561E3Y4_9MICO|nr:nuclear transport factor 2 family protein [Rudaeicoccus suwonensis]TWE10318.1 hypothetical protein BKA23_2674 [Rudaeicoccus suwonensis]